VTVRSIDTALGLDAELTDAQLTEYLDQVFRAVLEEGASEQERDE
jgi:hypothetical protein